MMATKFCFVAIFLISIASTSQMTSAWWDNICTPGDTYVERNYVRTPPPPCSTCKTWCQGQCSGIKGSMVRDECSRQNTYLNCQCCCKKPPPSTSSPPTPSLPPATSTPPPFSNSKKTPKEICTKGQQYQLITRPDGVQCSLQPICEKNCKGKGRLSAGSQCIGTYGDRIARFTWMEQCCCGNAIPPPPPPSPSPPPPSPPPSPPPPSPPPPPKNICEPGHIYEWYRCGPTLDCGCCFDGCKRKCAAKNRAMTAESCKRSEKPNNVDCECCCDDKILPPSPPPPPPSPPPPSPSPPPPSPPPPPANMCGPEEVYKKATWGPTQDCTTCTNWCKSECAGMNSLVVAQTCKTNPPGTMNFRCECCCKKLPPSPPPPSPPPPSPSPPPPSPPPPSPPPSSPPPPPPSPPPPSPSPPPPTAPIDICKAGEDFIPNPVTSCSVCTRDYCQSQCSERGASLARMGCAPTQLLCKCCCKSITLASSSLFTAIQGIMF
ncbi:basic proline-rich protein-like [Papaver somniferum]|uniref:basic proline-rich protein-like n=1 Tax=Papaver somniferum TaxID=3469 RepID=UPI000E6F82C6|nr:basic proline-rich protein-like [Papaver somniferum]